MNPDIYFPVDKVSIQYILIVRLLNLKTSMEVKL